MVIWWQYDGWFLGPHQPSKTWGIAGIAISIRKPKGSYTWSWSGKKKEPFAMFFPISGCDQPETQEFANTYGIHRNDLWKAFTNPADVAGCSFVISRRLHTPMLTRKQRNEQSSHHPNPSCLLISWVQKLMGGSSSSQNMNMILKHLINMKMTSIHVKSSSHVGL